MVSQHTIKRLRRIVRHQGGMEVVEWAAMVFLAIVLIGVITAVLQDSTAEIGGAFLDKLVAFLNTLGSAPSTAVGGIELPLVSVLATGLIKAIAPIPNLPLAFLAAGGLGAWLAAN